MTLSPFFSFHHAVVGTFTVTGRKSGSLAVCARKERKRKREREREGRRNLQCNPTRYLCDCAVKKSKSHDFVHVLTSLYFSYFSYGSACHNDSHRPAHGSRLFSWVRTPFEYGFELLSKVHVKTVPVYYHHHYYSYFFGKRASAFYNKHVRTCDGNIHQD